MITALACLFVVTVMLWSSMHIHLAAYYQAKQHECMIQIALCCAAPEQTCSLLRVLITQQPLLTCSMPAACSTRYHSVCQQFNLQLADVHVVLQWQHSRKYLGLHYPKEFQGIVNQCLSANPEDRPTMRQVVDRLQEVPLTGDTTIMISFLRTLLKMLLMLALARIVFLSLPPPRTGQHMGVQHCSCTAVALLRRLDTHLCPAFQCLVA